MEEEFMRMMEELGAKFVDCTPENQDLEEGIW